MFVGIKTLLPVRHSNRISDFNDEKNSSKRKKGSAIPIPETPEALKGKFLSKSFITPGFSLNMLFSKNCFYKDIIFLFSNSYRETEHAYTHSITFIRDSLPECNKKRRTLLYCILIDVDHLVYLELV